MDSVDIALEKFVNLPDLLARVDDDHELLAELLTMFQEELPGHLERLHLAISVSDLDEAARAAHALKGMLANLSMNRGASLASTLEAAARDGHLEKLNETRSDFDSETVSLSAAVDAFLAST